MEFDQRLTLPHYCVRTVGHKNFNVQAFWCEITCDKRTQVIDNHGSYVAYSSIGSKATSICNPISVFIGLLSTPFSLGMRARADPFE